MTEQEEVEIANKISKVILESYIANFKMEFMDKQHISLLQFTNIITYSITNSTLNALDWMHNVQLTMFRKSNFYNPKNEVTFAEIVDDFCDTVRKTFDMFQKQKLEQESKLN